LDYTLNNIYYQAQIQFDIYFSLDYNLLRIMSVERKIINLDNYSGPMTVVGYPDLSAMNLQSHEATKPSGNSALAEQKHPHKKRHHK
jgi:hypothetical protein